MANNKSIQILRGAEGFDPTISDEILLDGQLFYSKKTKQLYIGDGITKMNDAELIKNTAGSDITSLKFKPIGTANLMPGAGKHSIVQVPYQYGENDDGTLAYGNTALGSDSIALGINCAAEGSRSVAWGNGCKSFGNTAMAFGQVNTCYSNCSFISGNANECGKSSDAANGSYALVGGRLNKNFGSYSLISGYMNENNANYSNISGYDNKIYSDKAKSLLICGISNKIHGTTYNSLVISQESEITDGTATVIAGTKNKILSGQNIFIEGSNNIASGVNVHAAGRGNDIKGNVLSVSGAMNIVQANNSCIFGTTNSIGDDETILDNIIAFGKSLRAVENDKFVIGKFNKPKTSTIFEVGNGIAMNNVDSSNAFEVYADGHACLYRKPGYENLSNQDILIFKDFELLTSSAVAPVVPITPDGKSNWYKGFISGISIENGKISDIQTSTTLYELQVLNGAKDTNDDTRVANGQDLHLLEDALSGEINTLTTQIGKLATTNIVQGNKVVSTLASDENNWTEFVSTATGDPQLIQKDLCICKFNPDYPDGPNISGGSIALEQLASYSLLSPSSITTSTVNATTVNFSQLQLVTGGTSYTIQFVY